jgi:hypothetical protein
MGILEVHEKKKVVLLQKAGCTRLIRWREGNGRRWKDSKGVRRTAWREAIVGGARQNRADLQRHYSILVPYVKDYFGMGIGNTGSAGTGFDARVSFSALCVRFKKELWT